MAMKRAERRYTPRRKSAAASPEVRDRAEIERRCSLASRALFLNRDMVSPTPENLLCWEREWAARDNPEELLAIREEYCRKYGGCWDYYQGLVRSGVGPTVRP